MLPTILISLLLAGIVAAIILKFVRDKKSGKSIGCGCGCSSCPSAGICHNMPEKNRP